MLTLRTTACRTARDFRMTEAARDLLGRLSATEAACLAEMIRSGDRWAARDLIEEAGFPRRVLGYLAA